MKPVEFDDQNAGKHERTVRLQKQQKEQPEATPTEKRFLKALHWMHCPKCGHQLTTERHDPVEIDVCQGCGGIWLDATDLETILAAESGFLRSCFRSLRPG